MECLKKCFDSGVEFLIKLAKAIIDASKIILFTIAGNFFPILRRRSIPPFFKARIYNMANPYTRNISCLLCNIFSCFRLSLA